MLAPVLDPFHRPPDLARREWNQKILRIEFAPHPEAAADIVLDHADRGLRQPQLLGEDFAVGKRHLGGAEHGEPAVLPVRQQPTRLHREGGVPLHAESFAAHIGGMAKGGIGVALDGRQDAGPV